MHLHVVVPGRRARDNVGSAWDRFPGQRPDYGRLPRYQLRALQADLPGIRSVPSGLLRAEQVVVLAERRGSRAGRRFRHNQRRPAITCRSLPKAKCCPAPRRGEIAVNSDASPTLTRPAGMCLRMELGVPRGIRAQRGKRCAEGDGPLTARCCRSLLSRALRRSFVEPVIRPSRSFFGG